MEAQLATGETGGGLGAAELGTKEKASAIGVRWHRAPTKPADLE